jgi:signal transduction histidine kinase
MGDIVWAINTSEAGTLTLTQKLKNYGYELLTPLGVACNYEIDPVAEKLLEQPDARKNILLIAKEAINNIAKYSRASECSVILHARQGMLLLEISDNGIGMNAQQQDHGNGLKNMRLRTEILGGSFDLQTASGKGTSVVCRFPLTRIRDRGLMVRS